jgi:hypothetical protein
MITVNSNTPTGNYNLFLTGMAESKSASLPLTLVVDPAAPLPPTGVGIGAGNGQVFVAWDEVPSATSYNVYRSTRSSGPYSVVGNVPSGSYNDIGLTNGTRYYYAVTALLGADESGLSAVVTTMPKSKLNVTPLADAYVQAGSSQNLNFGSATTMLAKRASNTANNGLNRCAYIKLDLTAITSDPASALLVLPLVSGSGPKGAIATMSIYDIADTSWAESGIAWANAPGLDRTTFSSTGNLIANYPLTITGATATFDLTSFVAENRGRIVTLQLMNANVDGTLAVFGTKEAAIIPQLKIAWAAPTVLHVVKAAPP